MCEPLRKIFNTGKMNRRLFQFGRMNWWKMANFIQHTTGFKTSFRFSVIALFTGSIQRSLNFWFRNSIPIFKLVMWALFCVPGQDLSASVEFANNSTFCASLPSRIYEKAKSGHYLMLCISTSTNGATIEDLSGERPALFCAKLAYYGCILVRWNLSWNVFYEHDEL